MLLKKNIRAGKNKFFFFIFYLIFFTYSLENKSFASELDGQNTSIKVLDKISSKNTLIELKNAFLKLQGYLQSTY